MPAEVEARIAGLRREHPGWGPSRILWELERAGVAPLPGRSAVYRALIRHGLVDPRKRKVVVAATARPVCLALAEALRRHGIPGQILTDNGKVSTARFGRGPGPVMSGRICAGNGIRHLLTAPYSPTTTGKAGRLHKTMRAEFFTPKDGSFTTVEELQAAVDGWVSDYNTARPHQSCGGRPPIERFRLADRSITPDDCISRLEPPSYLPGNIPVSAR